MTAGAAEATALRLEEILRSLDALGHEQRKCLSCHCFREVAQEASLVASDVAAEVASVSAELAQALDAEAQRLASRLSATPGTHG